MSKLSTLQLAATVRDKYRERREPLRTSADQPAIFQVDKKRQVRPPIDLDPFNPSLQELAELLGEECNLVSSDAYLLAQWVDLIRTNRMVAAGVIPPWFKTRAHCRNCGDVLIDGDFSGVLVGCPWCHSLNRPDFIH